MNRSSFEAFPSLVGSHIEFSFSKKVPNVTSLEKNIKLAKERINKNCSLALYAKGLVGVILLAEMYYFYKQEIYFSAVRSSFSFHRLRPKVMDYLSLSVDERAEKLYSLLESSKREDRDTIINALGYFCGTYPSRLKDFKKVLTREEYLNIV